MLCGSMDVSGIWRNMDKWICMPEPLCCPPETITVLLTGYSVQFSSIAQSCPTLWDPNDSNSPGFPVNHKLLGLVQTQGHWVGDAIQLSRPLLSPFPHVFNLSQHHSLFQWVSSSHQVVKVLNFSYSISTSNEYSELISFRMDWFDLLAVCCCCC